MAPSARSACHSVTSSGAPARRLAPEAAGSGVGRRRAGHEPPLADSPATRQVSVSTEVKGSGTRPGAAVPHLSQHTRRVPLKCTFSSVQSIKAQLNFIKLTKTCALWDYGVRVTHSNHLKKAHCHEPCRLPAASSYSLSGRRRHGDVPRHPPRRRRQDDASKGDEKTPDMPSREAKMLAMPTATFGRGRGKAHSG